VRKWREAVAALRHSGLKLYRWRNAIVSAAIVIHGSNWRQCWRGGGIDSRGIIEEHASASK